MALPSELLRFFFSMGMGQGREKNRWEAEEETSALNGKTRRASPPLSIYP